MHRNFENRAKRNEFPQLGEKIYLDNAAAALYSKTHVTRIMEMMQSELLSNPHSGGLSGLASLDTKNELLNQLRSLWSIGQETVHNLKLFFKV